MNEDISWFGSFRIATQTSARDGVVITFIGRDHDTVRGRSGLRTNDRNRKMAPFSLIDAVSTGIPSPNNALTSAARLGRKDAGLRGPLIGEYTINWQDV